MQDSRKYRIWGIVGSLVIFSALTLYLFVRNSPVMKRSLLLTAEFESISSLRPGSKVYFYGMEVGKVLDIYLNPDNNHIMVDFDVKSGVYVPQNAEAVAYVPNMMYSARLEIRFQGNSQEFLQSGDIIPGSVGSYILDVTAQLGPYVDKVDSMVLSLFPTKDSVRQVIASIEANISQMNRGTSGFSKSLRSNEQSISSVLGKLEKISADLAKKEKEINNTVLRLNKATADVSKVNYAEKLAKINPDSINIPDIGAYSRQISNLSQKLEKINNGQDSSLAWLIHDKNLKSNVIGKADTLKNTVKDIREHPEQHISLKKKK